jgi:hypothetical protein
MGTDLLRTLATNFATNSVLAGKAIRDTYRKDPAAFSPAAAKLLLSGPELPGAPFVMGILLAEPDWLRSICDPEKYQLSESVGLVRLAHKQDKYIELKLADMLIPLKLSTDGESRFASRVFAILAQRPPAAVLPALRQLSRCPNARVRSKASLMIGQTIQDPEWVHSWQSEEDPRVSANVVESLWGVDSDAAREVFSRAGRHKHHRLNANGIVGLYLMAEASCIPLLFQMSHSDAPAFRAAAAWVMGRLEDPRFLPRLTALKEDVDPVTQRRALRAAASVRKKVSQLRAGGELKVQIDGAERFNENHKIRVGVTKEGQAVSGLDWRQFVVSNGPALVEEFSVSLLKGELPLYQISFQGPPSPNRRVKVEVFAPAGCGEDTSLVAAL